MEVIKIDVDDHRFNDYLKLLSFRYRMLRYSGFKIEKANVFKTKHGFHVYFTSGFKRTFNENLLLESLLGSDLNKQLYAFIEKKDVLFKEKHRKNYVSREKHDENKTMKLLSLIKEINNEKRKQTIIKIKI